MNENSTAAFTVIDKDSGIDTIQVTAYNNADFIEIIVEKSLEGYVFNRDYLYSMRTLYQGRMMKPQEVTSDPLETQGAIPDTLATDVPPEGAIDGTITPEVITGTLTMDISDTSAGEGFVDETVGLDEDLIKGFLMDKNLLEDYGLAFGIDLKKNKSFVNMLKDLREHVAGEG